MAVFLTITACLAWVSQVGAQSRSSKAPFKAPVSYLSSLDVVFSTDPTYSIGAAAVINAVRTHASLPARFWVSYDGDPQILYNYLACAGISNTSVTVRRPGSNAVKASAIHSFSVAQDKARLQSSANFARFALPELFPEVKVAWYLDVDVLPMKDLAGPARTFAGSGAVIRPALREGTIQKQFPDRRAILDAYLSETRRSLSLSAPSWNAGVWLADFSKWSRRGVALSAARWIDRKNSHTGSVPLWKLATQPLMYLIFHEDLRSSKNFLPHEWNCEVIQLLSDPGLNPPPGCSILHWNGAEKPWDPAARGHALWSKYLPQPTVDRCKHILPQTQILKSPSPSPAPSHCSNLLLDGDESDTDCGGRVCAPCIAGRQCRLNSDCDDQSDESIGEESTIICSSPIASGSDQNRVCVDFRVAAGSPKVASVGSVDTEDEDANRDTDDFVTLNAILTGVPAAFVTRPIASELRRVISTVLASGASDALPMSLPPSDVLFVRVHGPGLGVNERADTQVTAVTLHLLAPVQHGHAGDGNKGSSYINSTAYLVTAVRQKSKVLSDAIALALVVALPDLAGAVTVQLSQPGVYVKPVVPKRTRAPVSLSQNMSIFMSHTNTSNNAQVSAPVEPTVLASFFAFLDYFVWLLQVTLICALCCFMLSMCRGRFALSALTCCEARCGRCCGCVLWFGRLCAACVPTYRAVAEKRVPPPASAPAPVLEDQKLVSQRLGGSGGFAGRLGLLTGVSRSKSQSEKPMF